MAYYATTKRQAEESILDYLRAMKAKHPKEKWIPIWNAMVARVETRGMDHHEFRAAVADLVRRGYVKQKGDDIRLVDRRSHAAGGKKRHGVLQYDGKAKIYKTPEGHYTVTQRGRKTLKYSSYAQATLEALSREVKSLLKK